VCQATHLINLTGITSADSPAAASFISTNAGKAQKPSRIDHMLLSPSALQHLVQHQVLGHLLGSDHLPLQIVLILSTRPAPSSSATQHLSASHSAADHPQQGQRDGTAVHPQQWQTQQPFTSKKWGIFPTMHNLDNVTFPFPGSGHSA
jgi:hypothetical protein